MITNDVKRELKLKNDVFEAFKASANVLDKASGAGSFVDVHWAVINTITNESKASF